MRIFSAFLIACLAAGCAHGDRSPAWPGKEESIHVPSPDWRDQVVYFLMTDRFFNGDPANDDQGAGEFDPGSEHAYSGGDLAGVRAKLDYIQGLGATAVWLTPPVANVWHDPTLKMAGYHGYWAENFKSVDAHLGTLEDYRALSRGLHARGMYLIQDIVANHTGDFFTKDLKLKEGTRPVSRPSLAPFGLNDPENPAHRAAGIYHWTPDIADYNDPVQRLTGQMSGLDDLNTAAPAVRKALKDAYRHWIEAAGVDGFRIDTALYVEHEFWRDFINAEDPLDPGVAVFARTLGKDDFLTFGEIWANSTPFSDEEDRLISGYLGTREIPEMRSVLNFPLALSLRRVFAKGVPPAEFVHRLKNLDGFYDAGRASVNFFDNHDMPRFLMEGTEDGLIQALAAIMTLPGLPVIYAGTEQGLTGPRAAMFAAGHGSGGADHFNRGHPLYGAIRALADLRGREPLFRYGRVRPVAGAASGPGALAYRLDGEEGSVLVLMNTAEERTLVPRLAAGLPGETELSVLYSRGVSLGPMNTHEDGSLSLLLPPRGIIVLKPGASAPLGPASLSPYLVTMSPPSALGERIEVSGSAGPGDSVKVVVDGRWDRAIPAEVSPEGVWIASFPAVALKDGRHSIAAAVDGENGLAVSEPSEFFVSAEFARVGEVRDPSGDDSGPAGRYAYPTSAGFAGRADIAGISFSRRGRRLRLDISMSSGISTAWNPANGFDHVCFDLYIDFPGRAGKAALPRLRARMKGGGDWDYAAFLAGWKSALYSSEGADAESFGASVRPAPELSADAETGTVRVVLDLEAFAGVETWDGARFYLTSWDYDGVGGTLRPLLEEAADYAFGGGGPDDPRIMDDAGPFTLSFSK